jgi:hypothetical protein
VARLHAGDTEMQRTAVGELRDVYALLERIGWPGDVVRGVEVDEDDVQRLRGVTDRDLGRDRPTPPHGPPPPPTGTPAGRRARRAVG